MAVIKRTSKSTIDDLLKATDNFIQLLEDQNEPDAIEALRKASADLSKASDKSDAAGQREAVSAIIEAFEGEHELISYTIQRESSEWTEVEELSQASARVLSLARRLRTK